VALNGAMHVIWKHLLGFEAWQPNMNGMFIQFNPISGLPLYLSIQPSFIKLSASQLHDDLVIWQHISGFSNCTHKTFPILLGLVTIVCCMSFMSCYPFSRLGVAITKQVSLTVRIEGK